MGKKNTVTKTSGKARKARTKMRSKKASFAGHFADRLAANAKQYSDIMKTVARLPNVNTHGSVSDIIAQLNQLADTGYAPERKRGGRVAVVFTKGQRVFLTEDARNLLRPNFPDIDSVPAFVSDSYDAANSPKSVAVRTGSSDLASGRWIGFVSKKMVSSEPATGN